MKASDKLEVNKRMKNHHKIRLTIASIIFITALLGMSGIFYPINLFDIQFGPLVSRILIDFSIGAVVIFSLLIIFTLLFGRIYCSIICPFGFIQEILNKIFKKFFKKENKFIENKPYKYFISALTFGWLIGGSALIIKYIDPYTIFGSIVSISIFGLISLFIISALIFFKDRFFCTNICPVGTVLGLVSKYSLYKINVFDNCISCKNCERNCPTHSINIDEKFINNETCIKCLKCVEVCPKGAMNFKTTPEKEIKFNLKRRNLLATGVILLVFSSAFETVSIFKDRISKKIKDMILPPGAVSKEEFISKCYNCNLCVGVCPSKVIKKADSDNPTVHIQYDKTSHCEKDCNKCSKVCPTGAIKKISIEEKQKTKIATARIDKKRCHKCGHCVYSCPYDAISRINWGIPTIDSSKCIGCGRCFNHCHHGAIDIYTVYEQKII